MESDFSQKLKTVLSDPQAMAKIAAIAQSLGERGLPEEQGGEPGSLQENPLKEPFSGAPSLPALAQPDSRLALLDSVKPLLRADKQGKIDKLANALLLVQMLKGFRR